MLLLSDSFFGFFLIRPIHCCVSLLLNSQWRGREQTWKGQEMQQRCTWTPQKYSFESIFTGVRTKQKSPALFLHKCSDEKVSKTKRKENTLKYGISRIPFGKVKHLFSLGYELLHIYY